MGVRRTFSIGGEKIFWGFFKGGKTPKIANKRQNSLKITPFSKKAPKDTNLKIQRGASAPIATPWGRPL